MKTKEKPAPRKAKTTLKVEARVPEPIKGELLYARNAEAGRTYLNWMRDVVMEMKRAEDGKVTFDCFHKEGNAYPITVEEFYPLVDEPETADMVLDLHTNLAARVAARQAQSGATRPSAQPKLDKEGNPIERKPRGEKDPRTGCKLGTDGHAIGTIMLDHKPSEKDQILGKVRKFLEQKFDEKKSRGLASSWYATLKRDKPGIYGKY